MHGVGRVIGWAVGAVVAVLVLVIAAGTGAVVALVGGDGSATGCHATSDTACAGDDGGAAARGMAVPLPPD